MIRMFLILSFLFSNLCFANVTGQTITDVKVKEIYREDITSLDNPLLNPITDIITIVDNLLALGQRVTQIIAQGQPVVTTHLAPAISIIPNIDGTNVVLNQMENWSLPKMVSYRISFTNALNIEVIGFTYTIFFQHHGSYNGHGKYITSLKVQASDIFASWGSNFDASSELIGISNVGTMLEPLASGIIQVSYTAKGVFNTNVGARSFYVDGNGNISPIND